MREPQAWLAQAASDFDAGERILNNAEAWTYCHAIAKYQQCVEKSVKAMAAAVKVQGIATIDTGLSHYPLKQINALRLLRRQIDKDSNSIVTDVLSDFRVGEIKALCDLAPRAGIQRNTEYPYERGAGEWTIPSAEGVFAIADVVRFRTIASDVRSRSNKFVQIVRQGPKG